MTERVFKTFPDPLPLPWEVSRFVGIDPGGSGGGMAVIHGTSPVTYSAVPMPQTTRDITDWLWSVTGPSTWVFVEDVHSLPREGVSSAFAFGLNNGEIRGTLATLGKLTGLRWQLVRPQEWMRGMGLRKKGKEEGKTEWKNYLKGVAQQMFPLENVTLKTADALLLAEFCRRRKTARMVYPSHEI